MRCALLESVLHFFPLSRFAYFQLIVLFAGFFSTILASKFLSVMFCR